MHSAILRHIRKSIASLQFGNVEGKKRKFWLKSKVWKGVFQHPPFSFISLSYLWVYKAHAMWSCLCYSGWMDGWTDLTWQLWRHITFLVFSYKFRGFWYDKLYELEFYNAHSCTLYELTFYILTILCHIYYYIVSSYRNPDTCGTLCVCWCCRAFEMNIFCEVKSA